MSARPPRSAAAPPLRGRCRCGHLPTHHMLVVPAGNGAGYRLDPSGPCQLCGEAGCRQYAAAPP